MYNKAAKTMDELVKRRTQFFISLLEPVTIILLAVGIGSMVMSLMGTITELNTGIG